MARDPRHLLADFPRLFTLLCFFLILHPLPAAGGDSRPGARDLGIRIGTLPTGSYNAITDVAGVQVGHVTLNSGMGKLVVGKGPVRTGVTAVLPHADDIYQNMVFAAAEVLNGNGEMTGVEWVNERGLLEVPVILTNTLSVGTAYNGVISYMLNQDPRRVPLPVVAECYDGGLNDIAGRHVREAHVLQALESARSGPVTEGSVGAGTGMRAYGFKAGVGTSSRVVEGHTVGVLVNANCGRRSELIVDGVSAGRALGSETLKRSRDGSIIILIATDAPLIPIQLRRLCKRAPLGLTRTGTVSRTSSGDLILAFSTAQRIPRDKAVQDTVLTIRDSQLTPLFQAVVEATEEAILNAMFRAKTMVGRDGNTIVGLPIDQLVDILRAHGRLK